ncbi:class I SAM-dependent methyltransferase [Burkholderia stabilis]|uniref:class I SAM-dependent methyltransferase n=1 Tax=Burkholderia stabilis TaxID=95485 RepID=UPI00158E2DA5|nr:class I SAM-dependent methyltransferase [Burkholderia stabilis]
MHIERLGFDQGTGYSGLEAAIHIARYGFVKEICAGKRVLDIACGEGYGSRLMLNWGATSVEGVDISEEAIVNARSVFGTDKINFTQHAAETVDTLFELQSFDLIVSLETIEHVEDPMAFLAAMKRLLKPGGTIVVSCPNDWWYFPEADKGNPFHRRKYRMEEFQSLAEGVLGKAHGWYLGGPIAGFSNLPLDAYARADANSDQILMLETHALDALAVPTEMNAGPRATNASYFIGVWGRAPSGMSNAAVLPLSMDAFKDGIFQGHLHDIDRLNNDLRVKAEESEKLKSQLGELRKLQLRNHALHAENELMREMRARLQASITQLTEEMTQLEIDNQRLSIEAARYVRLRNLVPSAIRQPALQLAKGLRRLVNGR